MIPPLIPPCGGMLATVAGADYIPPLARGRVLVARPVGPSSIG
jgi:hypothetical protein